MASIKCGNCAETHGSVQEVRECYNADPKFRVIEAPRQSGKVSGIALAAPPEPPKLRVPAGEGWFSMGGKIYKVQQSQSSGHLYAKVLETTGGWSFAPGKIKELTEDHRLTAAEAAKYGKLYGVCCICGRVLTNEESIEAGIGPICAGRIS